MSERPKKKARREREKVGLRRHLRILPWVVAVVAAGIFLFHVVVPFVLVKVGIGSRFEFGLFRWGVAEYDSWIALSGQGRHSRPNRPAFVFLGDGEAVELEWDVRLREGTPRLSVGPPLSPRNSLWSTELEGTSRGDTTVFLDEGGLYEIRFSRSRWAGSAKMRWRVVER